MKGIGAVGSAITGLNNPFGTLAVNKGNLKKVDDSYLKQKGIDAEDEKNQIYGPNSSRYDVYQDTTNGNLYGWGKGGVGEPQPKYRNLNGPWVEPPPGIGGEPEPGVGPIDPEE